MANDNIGTTVGKDLLDVPFPEMVKTMGMGIAQAQFELDQMSLRLAQMMSGADYYIDVTKEDGSVTKEKQDGVKVQFGTGTETFSLLELGFTPTFYQFVDTIIEIKMSISMSSETSSKSFSGEVSAEASGGGAFFGIGGGFKAKAKVSTVGASFASKYSYSAEGSSLIRTKLVPVPPPAILEERIRRLMENSNST